MELECSAEFGRKTSGETLGLEEETEESPNHMKSLLLFLAVCDQAHIQFSTRLEVVLLVPCGSPAGQISPETARSAKRGTS